ncbi:DNA recombination protein RmuC, partial [Francisella philomiragia]
MILAIALIVLLVVCGMVLVFILNKKSIETKHIRTQFEDYKSSVQQELLSLRSKELTFDTLLDQEKQKNLELKQDSNLRVDELKQELKEEREKSYSYIEEIKNYRSQVSMLETQLKEQNAAMQDKLELLQNSEAKLKTEFENLANRIFE